MVAAISTNSSLPASSGDAVFSAMQAQQEISADNTLNLESLKKREDIVDAAREFEAVFISQMVKPMFEGIETDGMFGGGKGEEVFRGLMIEQYGKEIADRDITGIQTQVMHKLIELQGLEQ